MKAYDDVIKRMFKEVAEDNSVTVAEVIDIFESQFAFIRETIKKIDFKDMSEEEFNNTKKNFNIPNIGKLYTNYRILEYLNNLKNTNYDREVKYQDAVRSDCGDSE